MKRLLLIEKVTLVWWLFTTLLVCALWRWLADPVAMLADHALIALVVGGAHVAGTLMARGGGRMPAAAGLLTGGGLLLRLAASLAMLALWYGETYRFCSLLPYQDHLFAAADQWLFGLQPSIAFGEAVDGLQPWCSRLLSEAFNLGYWSYFPMQLAVVVYYFVRHRREVDGVAASILASFFAFYVIYMVLPVGGPQYYFCAIGLDAARAARFPDIGHHLATHTDMLTAPGWADGLFYRLVGMSQATGEFPTAAFPSSHIGCTTVFLGLALRRSRALFCCLLPFAVLLACATVYIQAHYFVDTVAGLLCGLAVYRAGAWLRIRGCVSC